MKRHPKAPIHSPYKRHCFNSCQSSPAMHMIGHLCLCLFAASCWRRCVSTGSSRTICNVTGILVSPITITVTLTFSLSAMMVMMLLMSSTSSIVSAIMMIVVVSGFVTYSMCLLNDWCEVCTARSLRTSGILKTIVKLCS